MLVKQGRKAILDLLTRLEGGVSTSMWVHLAKALPGTAIADRTPADFTEADFSGYAIVALDTGNMSSATINGSDQGETDSPTVTFTCTVTGSPQTIYCVYITIGLTSGTKLLFCWDLATPVIIADAGDLFQRVIDFLSDDLP